jgi:fructoselysine-6-P-deglycase FrlB-like protein
MEVLETNVERGGKALEEAITKQPEAWLEASARAPEVRAKLPPSDAVVAFIGCGSSLFVGMSAASLREQRALGSSEALSASLRPTVRRFDGVVGISRSGTTTELLRAFEFYASLEPTPSLHGVVVDENSPLARTLGPEHVVELTFAHDEPVVQTVSATSALAFFRSLYGEDMSNAVALGRQALQRELPTESMGALRHVFLGEGWAYGVANEAALKLREAAGAWTEAYLPAEYLHGPISASTAPTTVWLMGPVDPFVIAHARKAGGTVQESCGDALADLVVVQRVAVELASRQGRDPANPPWLSRAVILS